MREASPAEETSEDEYEVNSDQSSTKEEQNSSQLHMINPEEQNGPEKVSKMKDDKPQCRLAMSDCDSDADAMEQELLEIDSQLKQESTDFLFASEE